MKGETGKKQTEDNGNIRGGRDPAADGQSLAGKAKGEKRQGANSRPPSPKNDTNATSPSRPYSP